MLQDDADDIEDLDSILDCTDIPEVRTSFSQKRLNESHVLNASVTNKASGLSRFLFKSRTDENNTSSNQSTDDTRPAKRMKNDDSISKPPMTTIEKTNEMDKFKRPMEVGPKKIVQERKFPGPAGILPEKPHVGFTIEILDEKKFNNELICSQNTANIFQSNAWQHMLNDYKSENLPQKYTIAWLKSRANIKSLIRQKTPFLAGIVTNLEVVGGDCRVTLKDPTDEIQGTIDKHLLEKHGKSLKNHVVLVLKQTSVITTKIFTLKHYLNVTLSNVVAIYDDETLIKGDGFEESDQLANSIRQFRTDYETEVNSKDLLDVFGGNCDDDFWGHENLDKNNDFITSTPNYVENNPKQSYNRKDENIPPKNTFVKFPEISPPKNTFVKFPEISAPKNTFVKFPEISASKIPIKPLGDKTTDAIVEKMPETPGKKVFKFKSKSPNNANVNCSITATSPKEKIEEADLDEILQLTLEGVSYKDFEDF